MNPNLLAFSLALIISVSIAPMVAAAARRLGLIDRPDGQRKLHFRAVPLTGGPVILISCVAAIAATLWQFPNAFFDSSGDNRFLVCLLISSLIIVLVGIIDDRFGLRGRQKLLGQFLAAAVMLPSGIMIQNATAFGIRIEFGDLAPLITLFWILGAVNALNLIDGVDGLASTTGIVLSLSVAAVAYVMGRQADGMVMALVLAGTLCGFLVHNFPPARMFLGDSGSMLIGLVLGCVALKCSLKNYTATALIMPTAIWAIPIIDVSMAIVRRKLTGRSIYATDRAHLHHCLLRKGLSGRTLLVIVASLCGITGIGAVMSAIMDNELLAVAGVATALSLLIVTRSFGHAELALLSNRFRRFSTSTFHKDKHGRPAVRDEQVRLHGKHKWEQLWITLTDFAAEFEMDGVELMVNVPNVGEEYHATWRRRSYSEHHDAWKSEIPLIVNGLQVGQLKVIGTSTGESICQWMSELVAGLQPFETHLITLITELQQAHGDVKCTSKKNSGNFRLPPQPSLETASEITR